jgi:hypothetical protein
MNRHLVRCAALIAAMLGGACRAHAAPLVYFANMSGPAESPPNNSPGTGFALVTYDPIAHTLGIHATFSGLVANVTNAHIHAPTAVPFTGTVGVATTQPTFPGFPSGVTSGVYNNILDLTLAASFNNNFINNFGGGTVPGAEAALAAALASGKAYFNIHSTQFPGGEIRGFLVLTPEPASLLGWLAGGLVLSAACRRRRAR